MSIRLSKRLRAVADLVPQGAKIIDVGTDHAMVPVWLAQEGRIAHAWASDVRSGPLQSAERLVNETGTGHLIDLRLTDGLHGFTGADADTVIIAGMGGETMISILRDAPWTKPDVLLILEPQSRQELLRRWLAKNGYVIRQELLVKDAGRLYPVLTVVGGTPLTYTEAELHTGKWEQISCQELFGEYLDTLIKRAESAAPFDAAAAALLSEYNSMKERLSVCVQ